MLFYHTSKEPIKSLNGGLMFTGEQEGTYLGLHAWQSPKIAMERVKYFKNLRNYMPYIYQFELDNPEKHIGVELQEDKICRSNSSPQTTEYAGYLKEDSGSGAGEKHLIVLNYSIIKNFKEISEDELRLSVD